MTDTSHGRRSSIRARWSPTGSGRARRIASFALVGAVLTGCAAAPPVVGSVEPAGSTASIARTAGGGGGTASARPTPPLPTGTFPDAAAPKAGTACQPSQLELAASATDHAMMYREFAVTATNTGATGCVLDGFASVIFRGVTGSEFWVTESHDLMPESVPKVPPRVVLAPGAAAVVRIGWSGTGAVHGLEQAAEVLLIATKGSARAPVRLDPRTLPIDIVDGGTVRVGNWRPAPAG